MGNMKDYIREVVRNLRYMNDEQRKKELDNLEATLDKVFASCEEQHYRELEKLRVENIHLKTLLRLTVERIEDIDDTLE